jgi:hypothetical protein
VLHTYVDALLDWSITPLPAQKLVAPIGVITGGAGS